MFINKKKLIFFFILILFYLFTTNTYFTFDETLIFGGADGLSYMSISQDAPNIATKKIMIIHAERFFFPYLVGIISNFLNVEIFNVYKSSVLIILIILNLYLYRIFLCFKHDYLLILCSLSLVNLNPYITRFYISIPTIINDLIFILGLTIIIFHIIRNKENLYVLSAGYFLSFLSRQSSVALIIGYLFTIISSKKKFLNLKETSIGLIIFILSIIIIKYYSQINADLFDVERSEYYAINMRILGIFLQETNLLGKLKFLTLPLLSFISLIIFYIFFFKIEKKKIFNINNTKILFLIAIVALLFLQPILSGPEVTGRNIIRLTTLAYIPFMILIIMVSSKKKISKLKIGLFYIFLILHSMHPTFSKFKIFESLRF